MTISRRGRATTWALRFGDPDYGISFGSGQAQPLRVFNIIIFAHPALDETIFYGLYDDQDDQD